MRLRYHKNFHKQYKKLRPAQQKRLKTAVKLFGINPHHPELYNHSLSGEWLGYRSISFGGDWRAHYITDNDDDEALFVAVGTHAQLYK